MRKQALLLTLLLLPLPALASPANKVKTCGYMQQTMEKAMDLRLDGVPKQQALKQPDEFSKKFPGYWAGMVGIVYGMDRRILTGAPRADLLTRSYDDCMEGG